MKITIIGAGNMAYGIGSRIASSKHELTIIGKEGDKVKELVSKLGEGVKRGLLADKIDGDVVIFAIPYGAIPRVIEEHKESLKGKILVDISNPVDFNTFQIIPERTTSGAEEIAKYLPEGAKLVKAFNTTFAGTLVSGIVDGKKLDVLVASDDINAAQKIIDIVEDSGLRGLYVGLLNKSQILEGLALIHMTLQEKMKSNWMSSINFLK